MSIIWGVLKERNAIVCGVGGSATRDSHREICYELDYGLRTGSDRNGNPNELDSRALGDGRGPCFGRCGQRRFL